mgnify:CR=1 FL=1
MLYSIAQTLRPEDVSQVQSLEQEIGKNILAFSPQPLEHSNLSSQEVEKLQELEKKLGIVLVAVRESTA